MRQNLKTLFLHLDSPIPEEQTFQHFKNKNENMEAALNSKNHPLISTKALYWAYLQQFWGASIIAARMLKSDWKRVFLESRAASTFSFLSSKCWKICSSGVGESRWRRRVLRFCPTASPISAKVSSVWGQGRDHKDYVSLLSHFLPGFKQLHSSSVRSFIETNDINHFDNKAIIALSLNHYSRM